MRCSIFVLVLTAIVAAQAMPAHKKEARGEGMKRQLTGLLRKLRQNAPCEELSEAFGNLVRGTNDFEEAVSNSEIPLSPGDIEALTNRVFGFDIVNDDAARAQFTCDLTTATTLSELKEKLIPVMFNEFRTLYDFGMTMLPSVRELADPDGQALIDAFDAVGLLNLDPEGVEEVIALLYGPYFDPSVLNPGGSAPVQPLTGSNEDKCEFLTDAFVEFLQENRDPDTINLIKEGTGLNLANRNEVKDFFCAVIDGADNQLRGVFQAIDDQGIINTMFSKAYPYVVEYTPQAIAELQDTLALLDFLSDTPPTKKAKKALQLQKSQALKKLKSKMNKRSFLKPKTTRKALHQSQVGNNLKSKISKKQQMMKIQAKKRALQQVKAKKMANHKSKRNNYQSEEEIEALFAELEQQLDELFSQYTDDDWQNLVAQIEEGLEQWASHYNNYNTKKARSLMKTIKNKRGYDSTEDLDELLAQLDELNELANSYGSYGNYDEDYWNNLFEQLDQELESLENNYGSFGNYGSYGNYGGSYGNYGGSYGNYGGSYGNYGSGTTEVEQPPNEDDLDTLRKSIELALDFLIKLKASGLVDLTIDL